MSRPVVTASTDDDGNDEVADTHDNSAGNQGWLTAPGVDVKDSRDGGKEHDNANNTGSKKRDGVAFETDATEDERGVVKNEVNTRPLCSID